MPEREQRPVAVDRPDAGPSSPSVGVAAWADQWGLVLTLGLATFGLGLVLTFWPEATLRILAVLVSVQLLLTGLVSIVGAVATRTSDRGTRTIVALSGIFGVLVGLVLLRAPQQTVAVVGLLLGLWWVFKGLVDVVGALSPTRSSTTPRGWAVAIGALTTAAGAFVVLKPEVSFALLVVVVQVWLFGYGFLTIVAALSMRSASQRTRSSP